MGTYAANRQTYAATGRPTQRQADLLGDRRTYLAKGEPTRQQADLLGNRQTYSTTGGPTWCQVTGCIVESRKSNLHVIVRSESGKQLQKKPMRLTIVMVES